MARWVKYCWRGLLVLFAILSFFGLPARLDWVAVRLMLQAADYWVYAHAAYPSLFALSVGLIIGTVIIPDVWRLLKPHVFPVDLRPDWKMEEAIEYLIERSKWAVGRLWYDKNTNRLILEDVDGLIRDAATQGHISIWGRPDGGGINAMFGPATEIKIPHERWPDLSFDLITMDETAAPNGVCARAHAEDQYCYLRVNKRQILREWPPASYARRFFDKTSNNRRQREE